MSKGTLESLTTFKILRSLNEKRTSGLLVLSDRSAVVQIWFSMGRPVHSTSNHRSLRLGASLVEDGVISSTELEELEGESLETGQSIEAILKGRKWVANRRLERLATRLHRERVVLAIGWQEGTYSFSPNQAAPPTIIGPLDPTGILLQAAATNLSNDSCHALLGSFRNQVLTLTDRATDYVNAYTTHFRTPNCLDTSRSEIPVNELLDHPHNKHRMIREGAALLLTGLARVGMSATVVDPNGSRGAPVGQTIPPKPAPLDMPPNQPPATVPTSSKTASTSAEAMGRGSGTAGSTVRPPKAVARVGSIGAGRRVQLRASRAPGAVDAVPATPPIVEKVRRRDTRDDPRREATVPPSSPPPPIEPRASRQKQSGPKELPPAIQDTLDAALRLYDTLDEVDYYELLNAERNESEKMIRHKFRRLARDYHVDRFARYTLSGDDLAKIQKVFIALNRAHEVLSNPHERQEYDIGLEMKRKARSQQPGQGLQSALKAERFIRDACAVAIRGDAKAALDGFKAGLELVDDDPLGVAGLAYASFMLAQAQGGSKTVAFKSVETIEGLLRTNDSYPEIYLFLGRIQRTLGELVKAEEAFTKALKINAHFAEAGSELRHIKRMMEQSDSGLRGLFGRKKR